MPHSLSRRGRATGDETDNWFLHVLPGPFRRLLLVISANFTNHYDCLGLGIFVKKFQGLQEAGPDDGVAADPDTGGLAVVSSRQFIHKFIGQGPGS